MITPSNDSFVKIADESFVMVGNVDAADGQCFGHGHPTLEEHVDDLTVSAIETAFAVTEVIHGAMEAGSGLKDTVKGLARTTGKAAATGAHYVAEKAHGAAHSAAGSVAEKVGYMVGVLLEAINRLNEVADDQKDLVSAELQARLHHDPQTLLAVKSAIGLHQHPENGRIIRAIGKTTGAIEAVVGHAREHIAEVADHISDNVSMRFIEGVIGGATVNTVTSSLWTRPSGTPPSVLVETEAAQVESKTNPRMAV